MNCEILQVQPMLLRIPLLPHCLAEYLSQQLFVLLPNVHQAANLTNDKYGEDW
ncbi:hypothetical protein BAMY6639_14500 [Bacillus amyloliquefaciens UMAF6639]|nr:hypothetical protein BAMY6639_14500 [Bacillus amyloliquefaciens UMAF6639]